MLKVHENKVDKQMMKSTIWGEQLAQSCGGTIWTGSGARALTGDRRMAPPDARDTGQRQNPGVTHPARSP